MKRIVLFLFSTIVSVIAISQDIVKLGDSLLNVDDMEDARFIFVNNGMSIETFDKIFVNPNKQIIASNGSNIVCIANADKNDNRVASVTFICESMIDGLEDNLSILGYKAVSNTEGGENCSGNKSCKISHQTLNGVKAIQIEFSIKQSQE